MIADGRRRVLELIARGFYSKAALSDRLAVSESGIATRLRWLRTHGFAETVCGGRSTKWRATQDGEKAMEAS